MDHFHYVDDALFCEDVALAPIAAQIGTPTYVYSYATIRHHYGVFEEVLADLPHLICYSVKANSNGAVLASLATLGAGADVVSGGELYRSLHAGIPADRIVFSGVGKQVHELEQALDAGILMFNVESAAELELLEQTAARRGQRAPISLRVNPDVDPQTHPYISTGLSRNKFGIPIDLAWDLYQRAAAMDHIEILGIDCHIGSQLSQLGPMTEAFGTLLELTRRLKAQGIALRYIDIGGGLGIPYSTEELPSPADYAGVLRGLLAQFADLSLKVVCEPGRVIMGNAGVLLTRVVRLKQNRAKRFVVVDAALNDLIRPALYDSYHAIWPVQRREDAEVAVHDVVGPICESSDFFAHDREIPVPAAGDLLVLRTAGAYGFTMASTYNSRPRAAEVLVRDGRFAVIRARERIEDLVRGESIPDWVKEP